MPIITPAGHALGARPDVLDIRDYPMRLAAPAALPSQVDLRPMMPPVGDQKTIGSCTAWASTAAWRAELMRQGQPDMEPSELATYFWTRRLEGTTRSDAGASIRDAIKVLATVGAAPEALWPYDISKVFKTPTPDVRKAAKKHLALQYQAVPQTAQGIKSALAAGYVVVIGVSVYESFESLGATRTGIIQMPSRGEKLLGGHALGLVGYEDAYQHYVFRNSWSADWGNAGYGYFPAAYVESPKLASDLWIVQAVAA